MSNGLSWKACMFTWNWIRICPFVLEESIQVFWKLIAAQLVYQQMWRQQ